MPMYDYQCDQCGHRFEIRQSFGDEPLTECPTCSGHVRRVIHPTGVIFKGSGWFITDNRRPTSSANGTSDATESSAADSPSEASTTSE